MGHEVLHPLLVIRGYPDQWASDWSEELEIEAAQDTIAPVAPSSFALNAVAEGIELTWVNPTLNFDGTACHDLEWIAIYRKAGSGSIDPNTPASYDKRTLIKGESYTYPSSATGTTFYFVLTAMDRTGNESEATSELSESPTAIDVITDIPDDASGLIFKDSVGGDGVVSGHAMLGIAFNNPVDTWIHFDRYRLWWQYTTDGSAWRDEDGVQDQWTEITPVERRGFLHKGLDSTGAKAYRYKATVVATDGTESSTADTAGGASTTADASDNSAVVAETIFAMNIVCLGEVTAASINAGIITADKLSFSAFVIGTNDIDDIGDGTTYSRVLTTDITAGHILLSAATGDLDNIDNGSTYGRIALTDISAGHITLVSSQAAININSSTFGNQGIQLQYNAGTPRAYMGSGGANNYLSWDGTTLTVRGDIVVGTITFADILAGTSTASLVIGTGGSLKGGATDYNTGTGFWLGYSSGYKFFIGNAAGNKLLWDGSALAITGTMTCSGSSTWTGNSIATTYTAAKCTNAAADQTSTVINGGLVTTGTISFNDGSVTKAGMTAQGSGDANVRIWAGNTYANRASAAFRVTQGGAVTCSNLTITGGSLNINSGAFIVSTLGAVTATSLTLTGGSININDVFTVSAVGAVACSNLTITGGSLNINSGAFIVSTLGAVTATSLTLTGGSININDVFTVSAVGAVVASSISCTNLTVGAGSTWGGDALGAAKIPNLDCDKITSGTFGTVRIPNLSAAIITSGTLDAVRIPNLAADKITTGTLNASLITVTNLSASSITTGILSSGSININSGTFSVSSAGAVVCTNLTVNGGSWNGTDIGYGHIAANAVRTSELYIDGDLQFKPGSVYNGLMGVDGIWYASDKGTSNGYIALAAAGIVVHSGSTAGNDTTIYAADKLLLESNVGDVHIDAGDDIILDVADAGNALTVYDWTTTTGGNNSAGGSILVLVGASLRRIKLWQL